MRPDTQPGRDSVAILREMQGQIIHGKNTFGEIADEIVALKAERDELKAALIDVLKTGLNGGNNMRLAFIAASRKELDKQSQREAEASEKAVLRAKAILNRTNPK